MSTPTPLLGIPELPVIEFQMGEGETRKLPSVQDFVRDRPAAWVDDELYADAHKLADNRTARKLVIETRPSVGITRFDVDRLLAFAALNRGDPPDAGSAQGKLKGRTRTPEPRLSG